MLARPEKYRCLECFRVFGSEEFAYHNGRMEDGPAYWSDLGLLCSAECSLAHFRRRAVEEPGLASRRLTRSPATTGPGGANS